MPTHSQKTYGDIMRTVTGLLVLLSATAASSSILAAESCAPSGDLQMICGPEAVEDLVRVGKSTWLIGSGMSEGDGKPGHLRLIDTRAKRWENLYPTGGPADARDAQRFPDCAAAPDPQTFSAHGIVMRTAGRGREELLVVNHGREAIEYFAVNARGAKPSVQWIGCVPLPADVYANSVAPMPDGGFVTSLFYRPSQGGINAVFARKITGGILRWSPGAKVTEIPGTQVSGANGIAVSQGGKVIHLAAWGTRELLRFELRGDVVKARAVPLSFAGDNLRWSEDGKSLLMGGQKFVPREGGPASLDGWSVVRVNPDTLAVKMLRDAGPAETMQGITVGVEVGREIWVGQFRGNQVGYFPRR
jgi:hypothetical protein